MNRIGIRVFAVFSLSLYISFPLGAAPFRIIDVGDPLIEDIRFLSREAGASLLSLTPPFSADEALNALESVDAGTLRSAAREAYDRIVVSLRATPSFRDGLIGISAAAVAATEFRWRTDGALPWSAGDSSSSSLVRVPLEFFFGDSVYAAGDLEIRTDPYYYDIPGEPAGTNIPIASDRLDMNQPLRSFLSAGGKFWSFQIGRGKLSFGTALTDNLSISDGPDFHDFARLSLFSPNFKYSLLVSQLPLDTSDLYPESFSPAADDALAETTHRYLYFHRWDFRLFHRLSVGLSEGALVGNSPLELRFLNPMTMYHGLFSWKDYPKWEGITDGPGDMVGSLFGVDLDFAVAPGLAAYGQFLMNQYATDYEQKNYPDSTLPNGLGWLAGAEYARSFDTALTDFRLEFVYADPYLYTLASPFASYIWMRRLSALSAKPLRYAWLGHGEGRDFALLAFAAKIGKGAFEFNSELSLKLQGEHGLEWDWENTPDTLAERAPSGIVERRLRAGFGMNWSVRPWLELGATAAATSYENFGNIDGIFKMGGDFSLSAELTLR
ncbi:MAG: hypothetical protein A2413_18850 [Treponema sp. RIFOXYC1_FULL_61_9]|nr:MAG: hypothetical protein A2413_18850 [Treponema sp. RIFOXYC1_FULL_61_9]